MAPAKGASAMQNATTWVWLHSEGPNAKCKNCSCKVLPIQMARNVSKWLYRNPVNDLCLESLWRSYPHGLLGRSFRPSEAICNRHHLASLGPYATGITWIYQDTPNKWYSRFDDWPVSSRSCLKLTAVSPRFFTTWCQFLDPSGSIQTLHSAIWSSSQENPGCAVFSVFFWGGCPSDFLPHYLSPPSQRPTPLILFQHLWQQFLTISPIQTFGIVFCIIFPNCIFSWREISSKSLFFFELIILKSSQIRQRRGRSPTVLRISIILNIFQTPTHQLSPLHLPQNTSPQLNLSKLQQSALGVLSLWEEMISWTSQNIPLENDNFRVPPEETPWWKDYILQVQFEVWVSTFTVQYLIKSSSKCEAWKH